MSDKNIQVAKGIYAAFSRGDVPAIMQHMSDDLQGFGIVSEQNLVPWHMNIAKKQDVQSSSKPSPTHASLRASNRATLPPEATTFTAPSAST